MMNVPFNSEIKLSQLCAFKYQAKREMRSGMNRRQAVNICCTITKKIKIKIKINKKGKKI
jgi:hypothetical protein